MDDIETIDQPALTARLRQAAALAGISMTKLCRRAGISPKTETRWFHGEISPTFASYNKVVRALHQVRAERLRRELSEAEKAAAE